MDIPIGEFAFPNVNFDNVRLATALQEFVNAGSQKGSVKIDELDIITRGQPLNRKFITVAEAVGHGTRLFDALAYFSIPDAQRVNPTQRNLEGDEHDPDSADIAKAVFFIFMWILIRGSAPSREVTGNPGPIPNFLPNVMGFNRAPHEYVRDIASFELKEMNPRWVKHIDLGNLGQEAQNRLALGVAGYRVPAAILYIPWKIDLDENRLRAARAVRRFVKRGLTWDCFSGTRSPEFLDSVKNFNKNVENLLLDIAEPEHIAYFVRNKILSVEPVRRPQYNQYITWSNQTFADFGDFIFAQNEMDDVEPDQHHELAILENVQAEL